MTTRGATGSELGSRRLVERLLRSQEGIVFLLALAAFVLFSATLPSNKRFRPCRACVPITIASARSSSTAFKISSHGIPIRQMLRALGTDIRTFASAFAICASAARAMDAVKSAA